MNTHPIDFVITPLVVLAVVVALVAITWLIGAVIVARAKAAADRLAVDDGRAFGGEYGDD